MIPIFRQIKQKLATEKKFSKYLLYAFGEIILVVLGILIILRINDTSQQNKNKVTEITILKNLQEDINLDSFDIKFNLKYYQKLYTHEKKLLDFLQSDTEQSEKLLDFTNALGTPLIISLHKSKFQNLQNNTIAILSNHELRKDISRFYDFFHYSISTMENQYLTYQTYSDKKPFF